MWETIIVQPFTNLLLIITMLVKNFGLAIILFTILIKLLTYPLTARQLKSTQAMQDLQNDPAYKKMQAKYKDNKEKPADCRFRHLTEAVEEDCDNQYLLAHVCWGCPAVMTAVVNHCRT